MELGIWSLESGVWSLEFGVWSITKTPHFTLNIGGEGMEDKKKNIGKILPAFLSGDRTLAVIVALGLIGIILIFISTYIKPPGESSSKKEEESVSISTDEIEKYRNALSEELGNMLASMYGVGRTKVMVTIEGTARNVYATDTDVNGRETSRKSGNDENGDKQSNEKKTCIVIRQKDGSEKALAIGQLMPEIKGVLVICDGGDDENVKKRVINAVKAALDISENHICVTKLA